MAAEKYIWAPYGPGLLMLERIEKKKGSLIKVHASEEESDATQKDRGSTVCAALCLMSLESWKGSLNSKAA